MKRLASPLASLCLAAAFAAPGWAQLPQEKVFNVNDQAGRDWVAFESSALLECITGIGTDIKGQVRVDPAVPQAVHGELRFRVGSLHTGIEGRDKILSSPDWIDAAKFPDAVFSITSASGFSVGWLEDRQTVTCTVSGTMTMLGHTEPLTSKARVTYMKASDLTKSLAPGDLLKVEAPFTIELNRFGLDAEAKGPSKLNNTINVKVVFVASTAYPEPAGVAGGSLAPPTPTPGPPKPANAAPPPTPK